MIQGIILDRAIKLLASQFKLEKILKYVEEPNDADERNKDAIIEKIFDDELQEKIVKKLNDNIDIPFISEKTEEKALNAIYDSIEDVVKSVMKEKL